MIEHYYQYIPALLDLITQHLVVSIVAFSIMALSIYSGTLICKVLHRFGSTRGYYK
jgi:hypothetical protein